MRKVNIHEAKTHLSRLLEEVAAGGEVIISKSGKPVARLVPFGSADSPLRLPGQLKGAVRIKKNFDAPLPDRLRSAFGEA